MTITVRPLRDDEARIYLEIHHRSVHGLAAGHYSDAILDAWAMPPSEENVHLIERDPSGEIRLIAELDGQPVGMGALVVEESELRACYVVPEAARKGVGSAVVREIERIARGHGLTELHLHGSVNAELFYAALGYSVVDRTEHVLRTGHPMAAVRMRKQLT